MRVLVLATVAGLLVPAWSQVANACNPSFQNCRRSVVFPAYTPEGLRIGTVRAELHRRPALEISQTTGQPQTILYNNPTRWPRAVDPDLYLMALPHARASRTRAVYPVGY